MVSKDGVRIAIGVAALGWAGREALKSRQKPKRFGMKLPRELDAQKLAKQIGKAAEHLERTSEDVRDISRQAKRLSEKVA
jgi:hypothetical protein